tara:strand:+ start:406 stop:687 length:282 start_codon:yes stop_codon:yes gene_type:complete
MGAVDFTHVAKGNTASEAFDSAVQEASYNYGHAGYTGTIAEKSGFEMKTVPEGETIEDFINRTLEDNDKWGNAFCIKSQKSENKYIFYGFASC